jgi:hypothetical protein
LLYPAPVCRTHVLFGNGVKNSRATASWYGAEPAADNGYFTTLTRRCPTSSSDPDREEPAGRAWTSHSRIGSEKKY